MSTGPTSEVSYWCAHCGAYRTAGELKKVGARGTVLACATCGMAVREERHRTSRPFVGELFKSFAFPFKPWAAASLIGGGIVAGVFGAFGALMGTGSLLEPFVLLLAILGTGAATIRSTSVGHDDLSSGGDAINAEDWYGPMFRFFSVLGVAALPAVVLGAIVGPAVVLPLTIAGLLYVPAGLVLASHSTGCLSGFNVVGAVAFIGRVPRAYVTTLLGLLVVGVVWVIIEALRVGVIGALPVWTGERLVGMVTPFVSDTLAMYAPVVAARMLGVLVREHAEELM